MLYQNLYPILCLSLLLTLATCNQTEAPPLPQITVVADGLLGPLGMAALPDGSLLVAEEGTGQRDDSAGVSLITPDGQVGRLISGFRSSLDAGDLAGVNFVQLSPNHEQLYLGHFGDGHLWTLPVPADGFVLTNTPLTPTALTPIMLPLNNVKLINPFDLTFDEDNKLIVVDASGNGVATMNPDGTTRFFHRFFRLPDPTKPEGQATIDPVPTGITRVGEEYYITLTGGCPYPEGGGRLVAIDKQRNERIILPHLNMPIDVAQSVDGTLWVLEFARFATDASCFTGEGYLPHTGRLSRLLADNTLEPVLENLNFPGAVLPMPDGSLYLSEVLSGRVLHITFGPEDSQAYRQPPDRTPPRPAAVKTTHPPHVDQYDSLLTDIIHTHALQPNPGLEHREGDTPLARLGQNLFFDPLLSGDKNISCATCHHPAFALADGRALPIGTGGKGLGPARGFAERVKLAEEASFVRRLSASAETWADNPFAGQFVPRNSPTIINSALFPNQFWDGRVEQYGGQNIVRTQESLVNDLTLTDPLAAQALFPVISTHEMAGATLGQLPPADIRRAIVARLQANPAYVEQFQAVFGTSAQEHEIDILQLAEALAAFQRRFILTASPWDDYLAGQTDALTDPQKRGALLFFGQLKPAITCSHCHQGDLLSDFEFHNLLVPQLGPGKGHGETGREDWGRGRVTFDRRDLYKFRTPSLRNVELTGPYFHDGAFATLTETVRHHADIWRTAEQYDPSLNQLPPALFSSFFALQPDKQGQTVSPVLQDGLPLDPDDISDLVAFLTSLTDPAARDLAAFVPDSVPSGLPVELMPEPFIENQAMKNSHSPTAIDAGPYSNESLHLSNQPPQQGPTFKNVAAEVGLNFQHGAFRTAIFQDPVAAMGGGLCWLDYDNDGWLDLYVVNSYAEDELDFWHETLPHNALFRNQGGRFVDVSQQSGADLTMRGNGCVAADFNLDGWWDIYVTADGPNALLWNNGDNTFSEGAVAAGVAAAEWNSAAVVGDLNHDGWPDLFVAAYIDLNHKIPKPAGAFPQDYYGLPDRLYLSQGIDEQGHVRFSDVTETVGLHRAERGLGALFSDLDNDGDLDLYIANDGHPNRLYENVAVAGNDFASGSSRLGFRLNDLTETAQVGDSGSGMGVAGGDYDGDGQVDLFITNWEQEFNALYRNEWAEAGHLTFQYSTFRIGISGLGRGMTGWGTHWLDYDHDRDLDLMIINGRVPVTNFETDPELIRLYRNRSHDLAGKPSRRGQFLEATQQVGLKEIGPLLGRGSAAADYDNDGDLDVAVATIGGRLALFEVSNVPGNWLMVQWPRFAPGTRLRATLPSGQILVREGYAGSSYLSSEDPRLHVGLGRAKHLPFLEVISPDGVVKSFSNVAANQIFMVE